MAEPEFQEDYFQRIKDVKWESEPKVYWLAGDGNPFARETVGGGDSGFPSGNIWDSDDGIHWNTVDTGKPGGMEFGGGFGLWMRSGLVEDGQPVWLLPGQLTEEARAALFISTDGRTGHYQGFDRGHHVDDLDVRGEPPSAYAEFLSHNFWAVDQGGGADHHEYFKSTDGTHWSPDSYHSYVDPEPFGRMASVSAIQRVAPVPLVFTDTSTMAVSAPPGYELVKRRAVITPRETQLTAPKDTNQIYQRSGGTAYGKIRKGIYAGETINLALDDVSSGHGGYATGKVNGSVKITEKVGDQTITRTENFSSNTGLDKTFCIGYGHFVFAVGGSFGGQGGGAAIAYTEDGIEWGTTAASSQTRVWNMAVGARK